MGGKMAPAKPNGVNPCFKPELSQFSVYHKNIFKVVQTGYVGFFNRLEKSKSGRKWALESSEKHRRAWPCLAVGMGKQTTMPETHMEYKFTEG